MKVTFVCDSGATIHSSRKETIDLEKCGLTEEEWVGMSKDEKYKLVEEWAWNSGLEIYWLDGE